MPHSECPLCIREKKTEWFFENLLWVVMECESCHKPMVVIKKHIQPDGDFLKWLEEKALQLAKEVFKRDDITLSHSQRVIKDHFHRHINFKEP